MPKQRVKRSKKTARKRHSSLHEKWIRSLSKMGATHVALNEASYQLYLVYQTTLPPRMPPPGGASPGADLTFVNLVRGSDMTLPTGSAIVGALLRQSTSSDVFASFAFALADLPNVSSVGALFDQYRIEEIHFRLRCANNALSVWNAASPNQSTAKLFLVVDRDDNTAPTTIGELQQYGDCQEISSFDSIDVVLRPSITPSVFSGGVFSGYAVTNSNDFWLDVANTSIPHFGIKVGLSALQATTTSRFDWDVEAWYKVSFKNVR